MIQIPTNPRQKQAHDAAQRLRREAFARLFCRSTKKAGPANEAGPKILRFPRSGEVLRPVGGNG